MALIEPPSVDHWQPGAVHFIQAMPQRASCPLEHAGVGHIEVIALGFEKPPRIFGLVHPGGGQVHISPSGKAIF